MYHQFIDDQKCINKQVDKSYKYILVLYVAPQIFKFGTTPCQFNQCLSFSFLCVCTFFLTIFLCVVFSKINFSRDCTVTPNFPFNKSRKRKIGSIPLETNKYIINSTSVWYNMALSHYSFCLLNVSDCNHNTIFATALFSSQYPDSLTILYSHYTFLVRSVSPNFKIFAVISKAITILYVPLPL